MFIGKRLNGRYLIERQIGGGGMSNVYLATDMILEREVAVKVLRLDFHSNEEFIKRFQREAHSISALSHPNIVSIYDVGEEDDVRYIVMEYMSGSTLKEYIQQRGALSVHEAIPIMEQLASALSHAHHFDIIHRDIKPQNILMDGKGNVKLTDFGIATMTDATSFTETNSVLGSVHYLSPEQARGGGASKKSDIYSLGTVFFEMLAGRPPFSGESPVAIALKHLQSETPSVRRWNNAIPQSVENIVLKSMAKDSAYRYQSAEIMREDIQTCLDVDRLDEAKFREPKDDNATKAMPIIVSEEFTHHVDETIIQSASKPPVQEQTKTATATLDDKKAKKQKKVKDPRKSKAQKIIFTVAIVLVLAIVAAVLIFLNTAPPDVDVPDVAGMEIEAAILLLEEHNFEIGETIEVYDEEVAVDHVVRTNPRANSTVKEGTTVDIYKSMGRAETAMPNFVGQNYDEIRSDLEAQFQTVEVEMEASTRAAGEIIRQTPPAGTMVHREETAITIVVARAHPPVTITQNVRVPFTGGYEEIPVTPPTPAEPEQPEEPEGSGEGNGDEGQLEQPEQPEQPTQSEPTQTERRPIPQEVQIFIEDANHNMDNPIYTRTITSDTDFEITLTINHGQTARFRIVRDNVVIMERVVPYSQGT